MELLLDFVELAEEQVNADPLLLGLPDPNDLPFLDVASSGGADALLAGNIRHFKPRRGQHSVLVTTPSDFCSMLWEVAAPPERRIVKSRGIGSCR